MAEYDFSELYMCYPDVIAEMPGTFTSHEFILRLAHRHQFLYIEALYAYRDAVHRGAPAPFMIVHGILAQRLNDLPQLVTYVGEVPSVDIFGQPNNCAQWRKVAA